MSRTERPLLVPFFFLHTEREREREKERERERQTDRHTHTHTKAHTHTHKDTHTLTLTLTLIHTAGNLRGTQDNKGYHELIMHYVCNKYTLRYTGGMVPDVNQLLIKGEGIFFIKGEGI